MAQQPAVHTTEGGQRLVIGNGGVLEVEDGGTVTGLEVSGKDPAEAVADASSDGSDVTAQFNALLASLRAAGYLAE
ncbi:Head fiber protein [Kushneria phosphatilytica]|uniref:Head fiber protein n=1 Tax=Kushneria phosphatilytica TaxID=657387 RepID=A0A5C0ZZX8_9GAMM|nr:Head fiber protein [Kushneria phosphatilytica]QEL11317.1 Head fiber protein [Kushneria phosphatilytica]